MEAIQKINYLQIKKFTLHMEILFLAGYEQHRSEFSQSFQIFSTHHRISVGMHLDSANSFFIRQFIPGHFFALVRHCSEDPAVRPLEELNSGASRKTVSPGSYWRHWSQRVFQSSHSFHPSDCVFVFFRSGNSFFSYCFNDFKHEYREPLIYNIRKFLFLINDIPVPQNKIHYTLKEGYTFHVKNYLNSNLMI